TNDDSGPVRAIRLSDVYNLDPNDPPDYWGEHTDYTYTSFVYQPIGENGVISGAVFDENNDTIQYATIRVEGTSIVENTGENGIYTLPSLPYETYEITASYLGYVDLTQTIDLNTPNETLDFYLEPLPQVLVFGEVVGSNAPDVPLEGVLVTLTGYQNYEATTDADGEFLIENVYGDSDYTIAFTYYGYNDYSDTITIEDSDLDYGIVLLNEDFISAYNVSTIPGTDQASISWFDPVTSKKTKLQNDNNIPTQSYTNEPYENVWLGNLFENEKIITVTSVEVYWDIYELDHDFLTIDIMDNDGNVLVSSQPFVTHNDSLMTIDVPNISIEGDFYAMIHWRDNASNTDALTIDYEEGVPNTAYIKYPGETPILLNEFIGGPDGSFFVRVNTLDEDPGKGNREVVSYNIYRGLVEDIDAADQWPALNTEPITELEFIDETWSIDDPQIYTYAVEAVYVEDDAEYTFSNFIAGFTGIGDEEIVDDNVVVYPNPASSIVNLSGVEGTTITLYNILGEVLFTEHVATETTKIYISHFENGAYFISIKGLQKRIIKKLVITN
ncbi:MAG: carboxypeptidase-like regulatory domain-containing protein, partial [Bacteroidota bacterium]